MIRALLLSLVYFFSAYGPPGPAQDWTRFGWDAQRSSAPGVSLGLTPARLDGLQARWTPARFFSQTCR